MSSDNVIDKESAATRNLRWQNYISKVSNGDESALSELYDESKGLVYSLALNILRDKSDAEEVVLDVFKYVWRNATGYEEGRSNPSTWLVMLTRSRSIDKLRKRVNQPVTSDVIEQEISDPSINTESSTLESEQRKIILQALGELNPKQRKVVELAYFYQHTQTEIASKLDMPVGSVKSTIRLATTKLKKTLSDIK